MLLRELILFEKVRPAWRIDESSVYQVAVKREKRNIFEVMGEVGQEYTMTTSDT